MDQPKTSSLMTSDALSQLADLFKTVAALTPWMQYRGKVQLRESDVIPHGDFIVMELPTFMPFDGGKPILVVGAPSSFRALQSAFATADGLPVCADELGAIIAWESMRKAKPVKPSFDDGLIGAVRPGMGIVNGMMS